MCKELKKWMPLLLVLFLPLSWAASSIGSVYRWITLILFGYFLIKNRAKIKIEKSSKSILMPMFFLVIYSVFSIVWGKSLDESFKSAFSFLLIFIVAIIFSSYNYGEKSLSSKLDQLWIIAGIISSILFIFGERAEIGEYGSRTSLRILGTNTDPNEFAGLFAITIAVCVYHIFNSKGTRRNISIIALVLGTYSVLLSGSRGALIACVISAFFTVVFCTHVTPKSFITFSIVVVLMGVVIAKYLLPLVPADVIARMDLRMLANDGGGGRALLWKSGLEQYLNSNVFRILFGYGANGLMIIGERGITGAMHNYYLQMLTNFGLIGLFLYLNLLRKILQRFWICNRKFVPALLGMMVLSATLTTTPNYKPLWILMMTALIPKKNLMNKREDGSKAKNNKDAV